MPRVGCEGIAWGALTCLEGRFSVVAALDDGGAELGEARHDEVFIGQGAAVAAVAAGVDDDAEGAAVDHQRALVLLVHREGVRGVGAGAGKWQEAPAASAGAGAVVEGCGGRGGGAVAVVPCAVARVRWLALVSGRHAGESEPVGVLWPGPRPRPPAVIQPCPCPCPCP